ncbi:hypothetical protein IAT38_001041 [Cryptococcus sp. DSM 104549]
MPVCTSCAYPADYVYTTYKTKSNIRLGVCPRCTQFIDPLIEHPPLLLLLDLILLKPRVFLHLLFNRGTPPFDAAPPDGLTSTDSGEPRGGLSLTQREEARERQLWDDARALAAVSILAETGVRLLPSIGAGTTHGLQPALVLGVVVLEGAAQHLATLGLAILALKLRGWYPADRREMVGKSMSARDGRQEFMLPLLIPLTILYTSILPLLLQLILSIWYTPPPSIHEHLPLPSSISSHPLTSLLSSFLLPPYLIPSHFAIPPTLLNLEADLAQAWHRADRVWEGTRLLGGMSAGFGLRVLLPTRPWETTGVVLVGWGAAGLVKMALRGV